MSKEDTTNNGVSADEDTISRLNAGKPPSDRELHLNDIAENAKKARQQEHEELDIPGEIKKALEADPDIVEDTELDEPKDSPKTDEPEKVLVKVNGIEKLVLKSEVDAEGGVVAYQKVRAGDEKMRQAADALKRAEAREKAAAQKELAIAQREQALLGKPNSDSKPSTPDALSVEAKAKAIAAKLYSGDEAEAEAAIKELLGERAQGTTQPAIDPDSVVDRVTTQVQWELERKQAKADFKSKYAVIENNPEYRKYANEMTTHLMNEHPDWGPQQIIMEAGEIAMYKFREEIGKKTVEAEEENRLNKKRATDNVKSADAKVQPKPAPKAKTPAQIIADMQSARSHSSV